MTMRANPVTYAAARKRVLVVDDSFIMRSLVAEIVESDPDLEVVGTAENGLVALKKVRQLKPDAVLLDLQMPVMSGLETLRRLGLRSPCKVIILSTLIENVDSGERVEALRLGAVATIAKPSGALSLDLKQRRASQIVEVLRKALDLPIVADAMLIEGRLQPEHAPAPALFSAGAIGDQLIEGIETGVLVFDAEGLLLRANPAARRILIGFDLIPNHSTVASVCGEFNHALGQELWDAIGGNRAFAAADLDIAKPDGDWVPVRRTIRPIEVPGKPRGAFVLLDDIAEKQRMRSLLEKTMPADVATAMIDSEPALGGTMREVTVMFADIRGFTTLAEALGASKVVDLLNRYFSYMADVIGAQGGIIDKFIGDAIMALFGVPTSYGDDADRAVAAAQHMQRALTLMNENHKGPSLRIGVGLGSGPTIAGQIGAPDRMNYTVIGDPANLASRIESLTKAYGCHILICEETFRRLTRPVAARKVDVVAIAGREAPTVLYEVLVEDPGAAAAEWLGEFDAGVNAYLAGDFLAAQAPLERAHKINPNDMMAEVLGQRCRRVGQRGAGAWSGAWKLPQT